MSDRRFVDTNVLLYAVSTVREERSKSETALRLLDEDDLALSVQVLQEFYVQATRSGKADRLDHDQAMTLIESWLRFPVQETTVELLQAAVDARKRFGLSYWDAAIIEAARLLGCRVVLSEDLTHGANYGGVRVLNPFRPRHGVTKLGRA
jgi:predicted nucleic acid-binding protein